MKFLTVVWAALGVGLLAERAQAQGGGCMRGGGQSGSMMSPVTGSLGTANYQSAYLQQAQLAYQNQYQYQLQLALLQQQTQLQQAYEKEQRAQAAQKQAQRERKAAERRERKESEKERRLAAAKARQASLTSTAGNTVLQK